MYPRYMKDSMLPRGSSSVLMKHLVERSLLCFLTPYFSKMHEKDLNKNNSIKHSYLLLHGSNSVLLL